MIRRLVVRALYNMSDLCFLVADQLSPGTDEVWRDRRWKQFLRQESRLDGYATPSAPMPLAAQVIRADDDE